MRVMRANLLDTLNAQYVETARAKGLPERTVIMRHAVPNALHPLVAYQGVVLPYMLTGEIEVAIVFSLATVGPAIVGSMGIGDVYVTATLLLVLGATLIVGNIMSDLLLVVLDPRIRVGSEARERRDRSVRRRRATPRECRPCANEQRRAIRALVWRRFRRSIPGMLGLILAAMLLIVSLFAEFLRAGGPQSAQCRLRAARQDQLVRSGDGPEAGWRLLPVRLPIVESDELDPVTYQPLTGPDYDNPRALRFFVEGVGLHFPRSSP